MKQETVNLVSTDLALSNRMVGQIEVMELLNLHLLVPKPHSQQEVVIDESEIFVQGPNCPSGW